MKEQVIYDRAYMRELNELLDKGVSEEEAHYHAVAAAEDAVADYADHKYQELKDRRNGH